MTRRAALALTLVLATPWAPASALEARMSLAFDGAARAGVTTEARIELYAPAARTVHLETRAFGVPVRTTVRLEGGVARTVALPADGGVVRVATTSAGAAPAQLERATRHVASTRPLLVAATTGRWPTMSGVEVVDTGPSALPHLAGSYATVDLLVLDESAFIALEDAQLRALEAHLARCGRVLALRPSPAMLAGLRRAAGCAAALVAGADGPDTAPAARLLAAEARALPDAEALASLTDQEAPRRRLLAWLAAFAAVYVLVQALAARRGRTATAAGVALVGAAAVLLALRAPAHRSLAAWVEPGGRYAARLVVHGRSPGLTRITLPAASALEPAPGLTAIRIDPGNGAATLELETRLLSHAMVDASGSLAGNIAATGPAGDPEPAAALSRGHPGAQVEPLSARALPGFSGIDSGAAWRLVPPR